MPSGYLHSCDIVCHKEVEFDEAWINVAYCDRSSEHKQESPRDSSKKRLVASN